MHLTGVRLTCSTSFFLFTLKSSLSRQSLTAKDSASLSSNSIPPALNIISPSLRIFSAGEYTCLSLPVTLPVPRTSIPLLSSVTPTAVPPGISIFSSFFTTAASTVLFSPPPADDGKRHATAKIGITNNFLPAFIFFTSLNIGFYEDFSSQSLI